MEQQAEVEEVVKSIVGTVVLDKKKAPRRVPLTPVQDAQVQLRLTEVATNVVAARERIKADKATVKTLETEQQALVNERQTGREAHVEVEIRADWDRNLMFEYVPATGVIDQTTVKAIPAEYRQKSMALVPGGAQKDDRPDAKVHDLFSKKDQPAGAEPAPGEGPLEIYDLKDCGGWGCYVYEKQLWLRPPDLNRFDPPKSKGDLGPFEFFEDKNQFDLVNESNVDENWVKANEKMLQACDEIYSAGTIKEPLAKTDSTFTDEVEGSTTTPGAPEAGGEAAPPAQPPAGPEDEAGLLEAARMLSKPAQASVKLLGAKGPTTLAELARAVSHGKPRTLLKYLAEHKLVDTGGNDDKALGDVDGEKFVMNLTELGRKVHGVLFPAPAMAAGDDVP